MVLPSDDEEQSSTMRQPDVKEKQPALTPNREVNDGDFQDRDALQKGKKDYKSGEVESDSSSPSLPDESAPPPLPNEPIPGQVEDDGWDAMWDENAQGYYFYNRFTGVSQWENPRVPDTQQGPPGVENSQDDAKEDRKPQPRSQVAGGYDPAIHGDYDPNAWYAQPQADDSSAPATTTDPDVLYTATGAFNRFTGKWQPLGLTPENFNDENKSRRQMNAYFDVDAAANSHEGRSLKAERSGKKLTKRELKAFKEKRREKKEEKRRAWLRD
ncbi:hypothetical protein LOZ12_000220 [Ophidiomyces ophidiicola]|uniref:Uncharacterized protein n=1 Tax=Ophidiomyces ophidiicola TaxID=1387563 RepID=A0ACB8V3T3_9EURO|nr:hypothetical protein LOZ61_000196 [Ophidiomyces ophidiicola]KAI1928935.1 hypothetical protein LOZ60_002045 [Ophidiomyces ophidiicola]KAI1952317.1 hypothetical protein LOZ62_001447 [Ophidiomyces ophidiicola]KAI1956277.1 hypothetical protein LOZ59_004311 [Ophidiomyces ophidiicola]KAI1970156.1 hypothetical protein LOZ56_003895 [Ophidiomyces ophidiicola]